MKKSIENTKKDQETNQIADTKTRTTIEKTPDTRRNFFGIFQRLVCSPNASLSHDKSEIILIPKTSSK